MIKKKTGIRAGAACWTTLFVILLAGAIYLGLASAKTVSNAKNLSKSSASSPHGTIGQVFVVNTTDDSDDGLCDTEHCSLREAINAANDNPGLDAIEFAIPANDLQHFYYVDDGNPGSVSQKNVTATDVENDADLNNPDPDWPHSWWSIRPETALPIITDPVNIDGLTQPGAFANQFAVGNNAIPRIELDGTNMNGGDTNGLHIQNPGSESNVFLLVI